MTTEECEQMNALCARIQEEKDYATFVALLRELSGLFERKELRLGHRAHNREWQRNRPRRAVPGTVMKVLKPIHPAESEKVEISIAGAEDLFREIRIENLLVDVDGQTVRVSEGAHVDITFEAERKETVRQRRRDLPL